MAINVSASSEKITAKVADEKVTASVSGADSVSATVTAGFGATGPAGPAGPSGVITVTAPITNTGSSSAANVGLSVGSSLSVADGSLIVTPGTYATLVGGTVPASQLPSYVDDVLEYANVGSLPTPGESGKIYVALNTGKIYRWSGSAYVEISASPGSTDAVAEGANNLYFTNARARNAFGSGTTGQVIGWSGGQWTATTPSSYTLPTATASVLGGVKIGSGITITDGVISASSQYTLPTATDSVLGGVKIGSGVTITDGVISVSTNYAAASHAHVIADVTGLQTALDGKQASGSYAAATHSHSISDVTGLQTALDGKQASGSYAAAVHTHGISDVTGLQTALDGKQAAGSYAAASHTHTLSSLTQSGAGSGQVVTWNGSAWSPATPATYSLPDATTSSKGGVIVGAGLSVSSGTISVTNPRSAVNSDTVGTTSYLGQATPGSATSASVWKIRKTVFTSSGTVSSTTTATNVRWDDRLTATYS